MYMIQIQGIAKIYPKHFKHVVELYEPPCAPLFLSITEQYSGHVFWNYVHDMAVWDLAPRILKPNGGDAFLYIIDLLKNAP